MAIAPTNTLAPKKPTVNFPQPQPGQALPLTPTAIQQPQPGVVPPGGPQPLAQQQPAQQPTGALQGAGAVFDPNLSQQVVQQAQQRAITGAPTTTTGLVSGQTQELLRDPSMGRDPEAAKNLALDQLNRRQAEGFEQFRQATGGTANLGVNLQDLVSAQLQQRQEKTDVERQLDIDEQNRKQQEMITALAQGRETAGLEQAQQTGDIQNLINAAGGALGFAQLASQRDILLSEQDFATTQSELDRQFQAASQANDINAQKDILTQQLAFENKQAELGREFTASQSDLNRVLETNLANLSASTQKELVNLKAMVDKDMLMSEQDFAASEAEMNRQFQDHMQNGEFDQANQMAVMLNEFDTIKQQKQQEWTSAENLAQNAFSQEMQMDQNEFAKATQYLEHELELAAADEDFTKQQILMDKQSELELQQMTQNFGFQEKMAVLDSELQNAFATNDVERQKQLQSFQADLKYQNVEKEQGYLEMISQIDQDRATALANNDYKNADLLQESRYEHEMDMHLDNIAMDKMRINLEQQGIDMAQIQQESARLDQLIAQGQLDPSDAVEYFAQAFEGSLPEDFEMTEADPMATQKALMEDYKNNQFQYALAQGMNPEGTLNAGVYDADGNFAGLTDEFQSGFDGYMQDTIYEQTGSPLQADIIGLKNGDIPIDQISGKNDPKYQYLLTDVTVPKSDDFSWGKGEKGRGADSRTTFTALEDASFVNVGGEIWKVDSMSIQDRAGDDWSKYKLVNAATGEVKEVTAKE